MSGQGGQSAIEWKRYREDMAPAPGRVLERAQPVCPVVLDVEVEPEPGAWTARFRHCGEPRKGKADSVEAAKEQAIAAAAVMLCDAVKALHDMHRTTKTVAFVVETVE